ncbi:MULTISPECIES: NAD(P)H-dependent oxidoreductase [unclassified Micromonospora]|uniref:NAD(P)H-dependent oxidoreductase n=1 Tax=unclassified Micromonospora TaxID=2617518 RepID=UPI001C22EFE8|nr:MULTISPECIES: NAD(P)H-dependent oxidoreductase [unclassified Micromonospora]MBU8857492.1 NAD(P)H-dependent oxidoreductase [Micromonospora sp. WMMB482]MDM4783117.1 NAD(P)H-dependent oxidoreductase [Micromonospora sp. b486]
MPNALIVNGHHPYDFAPGTLNAALVEQARGQLGDHGYEVRVTEVAQGYDIESEVANHQRADMIIMQFPVNWMSVPWSFKKYMDEVYTAGMDGRLCAGDGRSAERPKVGYGSGGSLSGSHYLLSVTFNAPREAFDDPAEPFFRGDSVDDLLRPVHLNARFFGLSPLPTFAAFDVMKNPEAEADLKRFGEHLQAVLRLS